MFKTGMVPKGETFSVYYKTHLNLAIALFDIFYFAKDFDTFYKVRFVIGHLLSNMSTINMPF
jgi:hypothetical protein